MVKRPGVLSKSGVHGILWERVLDQLGPIWSKVLFQAGKTQQNDDQLGQVGPSWPSWDQLGPSWSRTPCPTVLRALLSKVQMLNLVLEVGVFSLLPIPFFFLSLVVLPRHLQEGQGAPEQGP